MEKIELLKRKWIYGECRHLCTLCKYKEKCWKELNMSYKIKMQERGYGKRQHEKLLLNSLYGKGAFDLSLLEQVKKLQEDKKKLKQEIERLHGVIQHLTRELDEAEEHAFCMQEKLSQLAEKVRF